MDRDIKDVKEYLKDMMEVSQDFIDQDPDAVEDVKRLTVMKSVYEEVLDHIERRVNNGNGAIFGMPIEMELKWIGEGKSQIYDLTDKIRAGKKIYNESGKELIQQYQIGNEAKINIYANWR